MAAAGTSSGTTRGGTGPLGSDDVASLKRLRGLTRKARGGRRALSDEELLEYPRLYRHACSALARVAGPEGDPRLLADLRRLVSDAHGVHYRRESRGLGATLRSALHLFFVESPRAIRAEWRLLLLTFGAVYGLAAVAWTAVARDLDLASSLLHPQVVEAEIEQLEATAEGEPFRGNFTFGLGESPQTAAWIMVHNMGVGVLFFAAALFPPFYFIIILQNGLMLGSYTGVAGHWGQAGSISSILWCHGVIEIQALILAGTAGLILVRAVVRPGPWSRRHALSLESRRAWRLLAPVFPLLFVAGTIEGFISPHAPLRGADRDGGRHRHAAARLGAAGRPRSPLDAVSDSTVGTARARLGSDSDSVPEPDSDSGSDSVPEPEPEPEPDSDSGSGSDSDSVPAPVPVPVPDPALPSIP